MAVNQPTPGDRTQALIDKGLSLQSIICFAASDYKHACNNSKFAEEYGGVSKFKYELFTLVLTWEATEL